MFLGLPLGLVPCTHPINCDAAIHYQMPMESQSPLKDLSMKMGFVLAFLNISSLVTCSTQEMRHISR